MERMILKLRQWAAILKTGFTGGSSASRKSSLKKRMIFYFLLIALATVFVAGEILREIKSEGYRERIVRDVTLIKDGAGAAAHINAIMDSLSRKIVVMILILIVVSAVILFMFVWQIASPIQYMVDQAQKMADGDLSIRIDIKSEDEIAVLGNLINELSVNLQEVVAQVERMVYDLKEDLEDFNRNLEDRPIRLSVINRNIAMIDSNVRKLEMLKDAFVLYTIESLKKNSAK
jgi:methyl-accepting chemotaxis protein